MFVSCQRNLRIEVKVGMQEKKGYRSTVLRTPSDRGYFLLDKLNGTWKLTGALQIIYICSRLS